MDKIIEDEIKFHILFNSVREYRHISLNTVCYGLCSESMMESYPEADSFISSLAALLHDADDHKLFNTENNMNARSFLNKEKLSSETIEKICSIGLVKELSECKYDYIVGTYSLHHLTDEQKVTFFSSLMECLNDGGKLLIGDVAFETRAELEKCR